MSLQNEQKNNRIIIGLGSCGIAAGAKSVHQRFSKLLKEKGLDQKYKIDITSCVGMCFAEPLVEVHADNKRTLYGKVDEKIVDQFHSC